MSQLQIQKGKKYRFKDGRIKFIKDIHKNEKAPGGANVYHALVREDGSISTALAHNPISWFQERAVEEVV